MALADFYGARMCGAGPLAALFMVACGEDATEDDHDSNPTEGSHDSD